jgi:hypothetical protein
MNIEYDDIKNENENDIELNYDIDVMIFDLLFWIIFC